MKEGFNLKNQKTNWRYLLIVIIVAILVGGILIWQSQKFQGETKLLEIKSEAKKEKILELSLEELKEGSNEIENVFIEKIKPKFLCDGVHMCYIDWNFMEDPPVFNAECCKIIEYKGGSACEFICDVEGKAKVKMIGRVAGLGSDEFDIDSFSILDKKGKIIDKRERFVIDKIDEPLFSSTYLEVEIFNFTDKIYFLIQGDAVIKHESKNLFFLYVVDQEGKMKFITSGAGSIDYGLRIGKNFYLKVEEILWQFGEDDTLKNKFPANKIIIKDSEISFK